MHKAIDEWALEIELISIQGVLFENKDIKLYDNKSCFHMAA